ncbi:MAG: methyltransferase domain-containing protein [Saprospirales bacterium]|nr:methyltransferase domain-containing protein [Saprospirales bacterium]
MGSQRKRVQSFFDQLAPTYRQRYEGTQAFLKYLHEERVEKAVEGLDISGKTVLDIGAGTGILYDYLLGIHGRHTREGYAYRGYAYRGYAYRGYAYRGYAYHACDISAAMLAESRIPPDCRWVGLPWECPFPLVSFDAIFLLGVTTYLTEGELQEMLDYFRTHLSPEGVAVLSLSNSESWDFRLRNFVAPLLPKRLLRKTVLGQAFPFRGYSVEKFRKISPPGLQITGITWLNATVFPFSRLFSQSVGSLFPVAFTPAIA